MFIRINTNSTCNLDCIHCYYKEKVGFDGKTMPLPMAKDIVDQAKAFFGADTHVVLMGGGEPLLYKHFYELLEHCAKTSGLKTSITTNGTLLDGESLRKIKELGGMLSISIEGDEGYNDMVRGSGVFRSAMRTALHAHALGVKFGINFTLTKANLKQIPFLVNVFRDKAEMISFSRYIPYAGGDVIEPLSPEDYLALEKKLSEFGNRGFRHRQETFLGILDKESKHGGSFDLRKLKSLYVLPDGKAYPAWNLLDYELGDLTKNTLEEIVRNGKLERLYDPDNLRGPKCSRCPKKKACLGDRGVAYFYTGDFWGDDVQCPYYELIPPNSDTDRILRG